LPSQKDDKNVCDIAEDILQAFQSRLHLYSHTRQDRSFICMSACHETMEDQFLPRAPSWRFTSLNWIFCCEATRVKILHLFYHSLIENKFSNLLNVVHSLVSFMQLSATAPHK